MKEYGEQISISHAIYNVKSFFPPVCLVYFHFVFNRYSLIPRGSAPGVSVGHTCTFVPSVDEGKGRIIIVGGANPSESFTHSHTINLGK